MAGAGAGPCHGRLCSYPRARVLQQVVDVCAFFFFFSAGRDTTFPLDFLVHVKDFLEEMSTFSCVIILLNTLHSRVSFISQFLFRTCQAGGCFICISNLTAAAMASTKLLLATARKGGQGSHIHGPDVTTVELPLMDA